MVIGGPDLINVAFLPDVPEGLLPARRRPHVLGQVQARPARLRASLQGAAQRQRLKDQVHRMQEDRTGSRSIQELSIIFSTVKSA